MTNITKSMHLHGLRRIGADLAMQARDTVARRLGLDWTELPHALVSLITGTALIAVLGLLIAGSV